MSRLRSPALWLFSTLHLTIAVVGLVLFARGRFLTWPTSSLFFAWTFTLFGLAASALMRTPFLHPRTALFAVGTLLAIATMPVQNRLLRAEHADRIARARGALMGMTAPTVTYHHAHALAPSDAELLRTLRGRLILLDFCAPWSERCQDQVRDLETFHAKYRDRALVVMVTRPYRTDVATEVEGIAAFAATLRLTFPIIATADDQVEKSYGVTTLPTLVVVDPSGTVIDYAADAKSARHTLGQVARRLDLAGGGS